MLHTSAFHVQLWGPFPDTGKFRGAGRIQGNTVYGYTELFHYQYQSTKSMLDSNYSLQVHGFTIKCHIQLIAFVDSIMNVKILNWLKVKKNMHILGPLVPMHAK